MAPPYEFDQVTVICTNDEPFIDKVTDKTNHNLQLKVSGIKDQQALFNVKSSLRCLHERSYLSLRQGYKEEQ